jgi:hypothetical protein
MKKLDRLAMNLKPNWLLLVAAGLRDEIEQGSDGAAAEVAIVAGLEKAGHEPISIQHAARLAVNFALKLKEVEAARQQYLDGMGEAKWKAIMDARRFAG